MDLRLAWLDMDILPTMRRIKTGDASEFKALTVCVWHFEYVFRGA